jgi:hypothetical protein
VVEALVAEAVTPTLGELEEALKLVALVFGFVWISLLVCIIIGLLLDAWTRPR